jgi:hypothetical protein
LEVLHQCYPEGNTECDLLPQTLVLCKLVLNGYPEFQALLDILWGLATPQLHIFVCFGMFCGNKANHQEVLQVLEKASPNLTTLVFLKPGHNH